MKKLLSLFAALVVAMAFSACSDKDETSYEPIPDDPEQILVMFYGCGGSNLDGGILGNILQSLNAGCSGKVKMTYEYRYSEQYQSKGAKYKNILRFTADENQQFVDKINIKSTLDQTYNFKKFAGNVNCTHLGDSKYVMASDTALTSFINWSKAKYPNAKKTLLILSDHGGGWAIDADGKKDYNKTRAILMDDNNDGMYSLSLGDVKRALSNAGKVDMLYTDACLMSTWENLAGYANVANYFVGSLETAPGIGGNYDYLIRRLKEAEISDEGLYNASKKYVDNVIKDWWEVYTKENPLDPVYGDLAVYDLRKIDAPLNVLSEVRQALVQRYTDTTPIPNLTDTLMGTTWREYIDAAISGCEVATSTYNGYIPESIIPQAIKDSLVKNKSHYEMLYGNDFTATDFLGRFCYFGIPVTEILKHYDQTFIFSQSDFDKYMQVWEAIASGTHDSYPISDFLSELDYFLTDAGSTDETFANLYDRYCQALQQFGYINCTFPIEGTLYPSAYQLCSPGVTIFPFNEDGFNQKNNFSSRYLYWVDTPANAIQYYEATDFDQKVHWCELLKIINRAPDMVGNPSREELK